MRIPDRLSTLVEDGIIDEVLDQLRSGKEADVFVVRASGEIRCAKVYKEANNRSFRQAVQYQEGRKVGNSRTQRALAKRTSYGRKEAESSWINAEVQALRTLSAAGVRVPRPFGFYDGVLVMEMILGEDGFAAPRLGDLTLDSDTAILYHEMLISDIVRMLCAGLVHGDLSEFNILVDAEGPVIIDLPQAVNAAGNNSASRILLRDVGALARFFGRFEPAILELQYGPEIWDLYQKSRLTPLVELTGKFKEPKRNVDVGGVLRVIDDARADHERKQNRNAGIPPRNNGAPYRNDRNDGGPGRRGEPHSFPGRPNESRSFPSRSRDSGPRPPGPQDSHPRPPRPQDSKPRPPGPHDSRPRSPRDPGFGPRSPREPGAGSRPPRGPDSGPRPAAPPAPSSPSPQWGRRPGPRKDG